MLTQAVLIEAAKLLRSNRKPCTRSPCTTDCDDCRAWVLSLVLEHAASQFATKESKP